MAGRQDDGDGIEGMTLMHFHVRSDTGDVDFWALT